MGTVNYYTSDYITLGLEPYDVGYYEDEDGNVDYDALNDDYDADFSNIQATLDKYDFHYLHVAIKPGYYEGFSLDIENNYPLCFDSWQDKKEAEKEATRLKRFLLECIDSGLCKVSPGWVTAYYPRKESIEAVKTAIKELKDDIRNTPTWYYCERNGIEV